MLKKLKGDSSFSAIYLVIVLIIAAILVIKVVKPLLSQSAQTGASNVQQAVSQAQAVGGFVAIKFFDNQK